MLIFLRTPAEIPGKCDWGYAYSPDPLDYVLGQFLTFFIYGVGAAADTATAILLPGAAESKPERRKARYAR